MPALNNYAKELHRLMSYDPETGVFTRRVSRRGVKAKAGMVAGTLNKIHGYCYIQFLDAPKSAHRLAFLYMTGEWPEKQVDHINGVRDDNRWCNLRDVSRTENMRNTSIRSTNTSGVVGVSYASRDKLWSAAISHKGKKVNLYCGKNPYMAVYKRAMAERDFGYHTNHGRAPTLQPSNHL